MNANSKKVAAAFTRAGSGGGWRWPARVYLALVDADESGAPILPRQATSAADWAYRTIDLRSRRKSAATFDRAEQLAARVNAGELMFADAKREFLRDEEGDE